MEIIREEFLFTGTRANFFAPRRRGRCYAGVVSFEVACGMSSSKRFVWLVNFSNLAYF